MPDSKPKQTSATITMQGKELEQFEAVRTNMIRVLPGINPNNIDVLRHCVYLASENVPILMQPGEE